jgi:Tfp pilus assembly protein PilP
MKIAYYIVPLAIIVCMTLSLCHTNAFSKELRLQGKEVKGEKERVERESNLENFSYTSRGRRDPFFAIVLSERKKALREKKEKGGYELEELKVVGVLKTERGRFVMMEDKQGNGILFKKGDHVSTNLWIEEIGDEKIVYAYRLKNEIRTIAVELPQKK